MRWRLTFEAFWIGFVGGMVGAALPQCWLPVAIGLAIGVFTFCVSALAEYAHYKKLHPDYS